MQVITDEPSDQTPVREWQADDTFTAVLLVREAEPRQKRDGAAYLRLVGSIVDPHLAQLIGALLDPGTPTGAAYRDAPAARSSRAPARRRSCTRSTSSAAQLGAFARLAKQTPPDERWSRDDRALGSSAFLQGMTRSERRLRDPTQPPPRTQESDG